MNKPLKIGLISLGGSGWMGGAEYIRNIILAVGSLPPDVRSTIKLCLISDHAEQLEFYESVKSYLDHVYDLSTEFKPTVCDRAITRLRKTVTQQWNRQLSDFAEKTKIDFLYPVLYTYLGSHQKLPTCKWTGWIPDFQHKYLPQFFSSEEIQQRDQWFSQLATCAETVVLSSKSAESDFHQFFPAASHKTKVLSFRSSPASAWFEGDPLLTQAEYSLPDRFFLISNQFWQHKNHLLVFEALKLLRQQAIYPIVVCTGAIYDNRKPNHTDTILQAIQKSGLAKQIHLLGLIPKFDQVQLMRRSLAIIQPSLFEGWSTLVEDARCFGKHMILSDLSVNLEQNPPNSIFFKRDSPEELARIIAEQWDHLSPGVDSEQETIARANNLHQVQEFGYQFLEIAKSA